MKIIILCCTIFIIFGCEKEVIAPKYAEPKVTFTIDSVLNQSQTNSLPKDNNNFTYVKCSVEKLCNLYNRYFNYWLQKNNIYFIYNEESS